MQEKGLLQQQPDGIPFNSAKQIMYDLSLKSPAMRNLFLIIIKLIQWIIAGMFVFVSYGGFQSDDILIPIILMVVAVFITPPVIKFLFGRRKKKNFQT